MCQYVTTSSIREFPQIQLTYLSGSRLVLKGQNNTQLKLFCAGLPWSCSQALLDLECVRTISGLKFCENINVTVWLISEEGLMLRITFCV